MLLVNVKVPVFIKIQGFIDRDPLMHVASGAEALARGLIKKLAHEPSHGFVFDLESSRIQVRLVTIHLCETS